MLLLHSNLLQKRKNATIPDLDHTWQWMFVIYMIMNLFIAHVLCYGMPLEGSNQCLVEEVVIGRQEVGQWVN